MNAPVPSSSSFSSFKDWRRLVVRASSQAHRWLQKANSERSMTFILGFKTATTAFLAADAAVTMPEEQLDQRTPRDSVFGEYHHLHNVTDGSMKHEGYPKIRYLPNAAAAFAGPVHIWEEVANRIERRCVEEGLSALDALKCVVETTPLDISQKIGIALACYDGNEPTIVSWNHEGSQCILHHAHGAPCMIGSVPSRSERECDFFTVVTDRVLQTLLKGVSLGLIGDGAAVLACILGHLQRFGISPVIDLMAKGIGGTYSGTWVDRSGVHQQPDTLYQILDGQNNFTVGTIAREKCLVASREDHTVLFYYLLRGESAESARQRTSRLTSETLPQVGRSFAWDFVVVISVKPLPSVTVIETKRKQRFPATGPVVLEAVDDGFDLHVTRLIDVVRLDVRDDEDIFLAYCPYDQAQVPLRCVPDYVDD